MNPGGQEYQNLVNLLIGPTSGLISGWIIALIFRGMYEQKDGQLRSALHASMEHLLDENKACNERVNLLLREVLDLKTRVLGGSHASSV